MTTSLQSPPLPQTIAAARVFLDAALREEGEALANACDAMNDGGPRSMRGAQALRQVQAAHALSNTAVCALRALNTEAERIDAAIRPLRPDGAGPLLGTELRKPVRATLRALRVARGDD